MNILFVPLIIQFVPPVIAFIAIVFETYIIFRLFKIFKKNLGGETICLVGPPISGKTTFLEWLKTGKFIFVKEKTLIKEKHKIKKDSIPTKNGTISIRTVIDTTGQKEINDGGITYREEIEKNVNIVFFFSIREYLQDKNYRENEVFPRLKALEKRLQDKSFHQVKRLLFIGTHLDEIKDKAKNEISLEVMSLIQEKSYSFLFSKYDLILCDLREKRDYAEILSKLSEL